MSAQRKNKRLGSRRRVANQNEIPEADVLHVTDNPIAQPHIPEENSGFLNLLCNPDKSQSEPQCPPEPANRRKLGSRRKNKERQHVKDSATESYYEPENESEEKTRGREAVETALSLMSQSEKQEQSSHRSVHDMSATADSSLCSGTTHGYEFQNSTLKGNSLMNESHVESVVVGFSTTAEMATDENSPRQNTELEYGTEAATTEELPPDEDQNEHFFLPLEPQPEDNSVSIDLQTNTDFNPVGNRRKLGSSRRSKGSQPVKDSIANLYHKAQDEVVENVRANEAIEIAKMSLLVETEVLTDTHQTKTPGSPVRETEHLVGISDLNNSSLHPSLAFNQQLIGQSNVREKPDELPDVYCVTEKDTTERDDDTDLLLQWGILQANYLVSESHMKSESIEPSITVITTERKSPGEHTEPESVGEQAVEISPKKLTMEENDHFELAQVSRGQHSENTVNKVHGQEVKPTQRQEHDSSLHSASTPSYSSEVQIPTPTNCPEADLECLIPNIETDVKVEMSVESLEATLEGMDKSDTLQSEDEGVNHSQDAVNTICEQVVKAEQMQELHDIHYYFQSIKHDTAENSDNCSVNLKTQDELRHAYQSELTVKNTDSASKQEVSNPSKQDDHHTTENKIQALDQINEDFHVYDNEKPHTSDIEGLDTAISQVYEIKGQGEDNIMPSAGQTSDQEKENNGENEALRTTCMLLVERKSVEELSQESKHEIIMSVTHEAGFEVEVSVESATLERTDTSDTLQSGEAKGINYSEDKLQEPTQMQKMSQTEYASESVIPCVPKNFEIISLNLTGQAEIEDAHQFELSVKSTEDSATKQEVSNPDNKHEHPTKENFESLDQINEDTRKSQMSDVERLDATVGHVYEPDGQGEADIKPSAEQTSQVEKGHFSEVEKTEPSLQTLQSEIHASLDYQPQDNSVSTNEQINTNFGPSGNRRKLGSSRRNKGRQHVKPLETTKMSLASQVKWQEELSQESEDDIMSVTHDSSLHSASTSEVQIPTPTTCPEADLECLIPKSEILLEEHDERETDLKVEMSVESLEATLEETDKSDTLQSEDEGVNHSEDAVHTICEQEVKPEQMYEIYETCYSFESVLHDTTENSDTCKGNLKDQTEPRDTYQSEIIVKSTDDPALQSEDKGVTHSENKVHEQEVKPAQMQDMSQIEYSSESVILHATENSEIISLNPTGQAEIKDTTQFELSVKSTDDSAAMQEVSNPDNKHEHPTKENNLDALDQINEDTRKPQTSDTERLDAAVGQLYETEGQGETDIKPSAEQMSPQKEELFSEVEKTKLSLQSHQSETYTPFDSQPWDKHVVMDEQNKAHFNPTGNRRKLGSSRRNKGGRHVNGCSYKQEDVENIRGLEPLETTKMSLALQEMGQEESSQESEHVAESYQIPTQELVGNTMGNKRLETPKMSLTTETAIQEISMESMLEVMDKFDTSQTGDISDAHIDTYELNSISVHSNSTVAQPVIDQSNSRKMPDKDIPHMYSATDTEIKEGDNDTDFILQCEILQANDLKPEGNRPYITLEITPENNSCREQTEPECSVEKVAVSSPKEELLTDEEQNEHFSLCKVRGAQHTETAVKKVHTEEDNPEPIQEMHQIDYISVKESKSLQTLQSEEHACLDSHPKDNFQSTKEETHTGFKPTGNRRKLGSSRRNKGKQHVLDSGTETYQQPKEKVVENTETINIPLSTESTKQQIDTGFKPAEKIRQIRSTLNEGENTEKVPEEDTLSQNVMDISTAVTADITSRSDKDDFHKFSEKVNEEEKKHNLKESENSTLLTGYDRVKTDLIQSSEASVCNDDSDIRIISYHDDNITFRSITSDVLCQEEVFQVQAMETLPYDKDLLGQQIHIQQTNFVIEMVGDEVGRSIQQHGQDQVEESCEHPTKKGQDEHLEGKSKQKKRKIGSTRRTGLLRKQEEETGNTDEAKESNLHTEIDMRDLDSTEVVEDLPLIVTTELAQNETAQPSLSTVVEVQQETSSVCDLGQNLQSSISDLHTIECNMIAKTDDLMALLSEQSASHHETVVNPVTFIHGADVRNYGEIVGAGEEPSEGDDFTSTVMVTERNRHSVNQLLPPNTEDAVNTDSGITVTFCEISPSTQNDEQSPDDTKVIQDQDLKSSEEEPTNAKASIQKPMNEEAHNINIVMKKASPNFSSANRRRKMGSTRRNLGSHHKGEDLHQKQDVDNEATATDVGDALSKGVSGIKEDLQLQKEHTESDLQKGKEKVFETVKYSHTGVSQLKVLAQQAVEEDLPSLSNILETEHQLTSDDFSAKPSTSPKRDTMSESISGGRRRKMGSHRKSSGHHTHETATEGREIDAEQGRDVRGLTDEEHRKESLGLDKISEVDESGTKPSSNISRSKGGGPTRPESEKAPKQVPAVQHCYAEVRLGQESQRKISLEGDSTGLGVRSKSYNVVMVGDASVGKTSFMKRAQSGKFSLDLPSSVGLDSCMWTVVVDGKPVVLQLWDTAGQERFRSITRQIFHKAHAFLLMYDIASSQSFSAVSYWADCIQEGAAENMSILLLGNKSDHEKRQVNTQQGEILAKEYQFEFMECSAATGENVIHSLETVARMLIQKFDTREEAVVLHKEPQQKKKSGCC